MKKFLIALATTATVAAATVAVPNTADARCRAWPCGAAIGAGAVLLGGALLAPRYRPYAAVEGYEPYPAYVSGYPVDCPGGYWARRPVYDRFGYQIGWSQPRFFCPAY